MFWEWKLMRNTMVKSVFRYLYFLISYRHASHYPLESNMAAYKMAAVKFTPPNNFHLGLIRSHMVVIHLFLMLCNLQRAVRDLRPILYILQMRLQATQDSTPAVVWNTHCGTYTILPNSVEGSYTDTQQWLY
jgi:hypothetical protein